MDKKTLNRIIEAALEEDIGSGDVTTNLIIPRSIKSKTFLLAKEDGIIAGLFIAKTVFKKLDKKVVWKNLVKEGARVSGGTKIAEIKGSYRTLLTGERTALNFLQRISGIATMTSKFVEQVGSTKTKILDTRKTAPGLRLLDKYAVKIGGGTNHRIGLYDMVMIKDNHIKAAGSITDAVRQIKKNLMGILRRSPFGPSGESFGHPFGKRKMKIEVETANLDEVKEALNAGVDIIMLDNMSLQEMKEAVAMINGKTKVEASGKVNLENVHSVAETGVDYISVGALTHSVKALDIGMYFE